MFGPGGDLKELVDCEFDFVVMGGDAFLKLVTPSQRFVPGLVVRKNL